MPEREAASLECHAGTVAHREIKMTISHIPTDYIFTLSSENVETL
jgi:hypothetical protein